ncbi:MAG: DUF1800 family protein [Caulobacter sp.]|nr:DUF1800 family protein [Caulobacter sp.]
MAYPSRDLMAAVAATRFGLGARPGEIEAARSDPQGWLSGQIVARGADLSVATSELSARRIAGFRNFRADRREQRRDMAELKAGDMADSGMAPAKDPVQVTRGMIREGAAEDFLLRARLGASTDASFRERWALFWCNHFTVSGIKLLTAVTVGPFEQEAIRPRVFGRFEDLLIASSAHPAMLLYLDQAQSTGPGSRLGMALAKRPNLNNRNGGLNENLAREILELHTVGVGGGYSQADVTEFARCLTGWGVGNQREPEKFGQFVFRDTAHEPGDRTVLGRRYEDSGVDQATAVMKDLAANPKTARFVCGKIARHFVSDVPPPALVDDLEQAWLSSGGNLSEVARSLVASPHAWAPEPSKFKTPYEFLISAYRAIGGQPGAIEHLAPTLNGLGQKAYSPPSPKGWPDESAYWATPDALIKRMAWAEAFSAQVAPERDPGAIARTALGGRLSERTGKAVARAESRPEALSLLLMSPEFQRR